jgi:hypothetical protein
MSISTYDSYVDKVSTTFCLNICKSLTASNFASMWVSSPNVGSIPTTATICDNTTAGALNKETPIGLASYDWRLNGVTRQGNSNAQFVFFDRLSHQGGLSTTTASTQTTNLPTAALTRYTNGANVHAALEFYTANSGGIATTATISYTNQDGISGKISKPVTFGGELATTLSIVPLDDGDTGVRSVESVTLAADTTVSSNFGVTLIRFLGMAEPNVKYDGIYGANSYNAIIGGGCHFEPILPGACLQFLNTTGVATNTTFALHFLDAQ